MKKYILMGGVLLFAFALSANFTFAAGFFNGFETDTAGWFDDGINITRVASTTDGITSATGSYHAEAKVDAFTRWGGYGSIANCSGDSCAAAFPTNGYVTQVDIYLDMNLADGSDKRFDYSSAINDPSGSHRRDFIFNVGTDPTTANQWVMSASNNAPGWPADSGRDPFTIGNSGWYTFRHTFKNNGSGVLEVVMDVLNSSGTVLHSWTLSDPSDIIGTTVGGNRYGWFTSQRFDFDWLAVDNSKKFDITVAHGEITSPASDGEHVSGTLNLTATYDDGDVPNTDDGVQWAVRQGTCAAGVGTVLGNVDGHSDVATWNGNNFSFSKDVSAFPPGNYCFVFNPTDDAGQPNVRETRNFVIDAPIVYVTTDAANTVTPVSATVNGTNGPFAATDTSFWLGTSSAGSFTPSTNPASELPSEWNGIDSLAQLAYAPFSHDYTGLTPNTKYYFVAWSLVGGTWYPGAVLDFTTDEIAPTVVVPATKDQCKNNGWQTLKDALLEGKSFKNQGDCVSFVATKNKNAAAGSN